MEPIDNMQMQMNKAWFNTPKNYADIPLACCSFIPECDEHLKPKVGMTFEGLEAVVGVQKPRLSLSHNGIPSLQILGWRGTSGWLKGLAFEIDGYRPSLWIYL